MATNPVNFRQLIYEIVSWINSDKTRSILEIKGPKRNLKMNG